MTLKFIPKAMFNLLIACTLFISSGAAALGQVANPDPDEGWLLGSPAAAGLNEDEIALSSND